MFRIENLHIEYADKTIFEHCTLSIQGHRIALVGKNGSGKSTLLKVLAGLIPGCTTEKTTAYFAQEEELSGDLFDYLLGEPDYDNYTDWLDQEVKAKEMLRALRVPLNNLEHLSGGQQTKVRLIKTFLQNAEVLLLDEPTNHLDIESINTLRTWLDEYSGDVILVSHDRALLEDVATTIIEVAQEMKQYDCGYTEYKERKEKEHLEQEQAYSSAVKEKKRLKHIALQQQVSLQKSNAKKAKLKASFDGDTGAFAAKFEKLERAQRSMGSSKKDALRRSEKVSVDKPKAEEFIKLEFAMERGPEIVVDMQQTLQRESTLLCKEVNLEVHRGEKHALLGANGSGKTTLLDKIWNKEVEGVVKAYITQKRSITFDGSLLNYVVQKHGISSGIAREQLARLLFKRDRVFAPVNELSGGELMRVHLLNALLNGANLLLLDEPTNDLDIESIEILERAMQEFGGAIIFASHDEKLVQNVAEFTHYITHEKLISAHTQ